MAKKVKRRVKTQVRTKTRRVYVAAKSSAKRARRSLGERVDAKDIVLAVGGAGVGAVGGSLLLSKMPESVPEVAKNGILAAAGGFLAYKGLKKKNKILLGLGLGAAATGATGLISSAVSGSLLNGPANYPLAAPYSALNAPYIGLNGESAPTVGAPLAGLNETEEFI